MAQAKLKLYRNCLLNVYVSHRLFRNVPLKEKFDKPLFTAMLANIWVKEGGKRDRQVCSTPKVTRTP